MLDAFVDMAPPPGKRDAVSRTVSPDEEEFSGFCLQDPGKHEPCPQGPDRFFANLFGNLQ